MNEQQVKETMTELNTLVGLSEKEATEQLEASGWIVRVSVVDGEYFMLTMDHRTDRTNLEINDGKVTKISIG